MMLTLTDQQRQALRETDDAGPVTVLDPVTHSQYVLVRADVFQECDWLRDISPRDAYPSVDRFMAEDDDADPTLESYQDDSTAENLE